MGYYPRTTKSGNLAHLLYEKEKPVSLGPELKCMADAILCAHLRVELLEGAVPMHEKKYNRDYGAGAGNVICLHEEW